MARLALNLIVELIGLPSVERETRRASLLLLTHIVEAAIVAKPPIQYHWVGAV